MQTSYDIGGLPQRHWITTAVMAVVPVAAASLLGNLATAPNIAGWYAQLAKPSFNPPNWIFAPVWTLLYVMMAYAFFRILRKPKATPLRASAIAAFLIQMALNAAWSWAFFAMHSPAFGFAVIVALWVAIAATLVLFRRIDGVAGALLIPYLAWVSFAMLLNAEIWRLNGGA